LNINNPAPPPFSPYSYSGSLGAAAIYVPAAKTIVMSAYLANDQDLSVMHGTQEIVNCADMGASSRGHIGCTYCDGTEVGYKNENVAAKTLSLYGVTHS